MYNMYHLIVCIPSECYNINTEIEGGRNNNCPAASVSLYVSKHNYCLLSLKKNIINQPFGFFWHYICTWYTT